MSASSRTADGHDQIHQSLDGLDLSRGSSSNTARSGKSRIGSANAPEFRPRGLAATAAPFVPRSAPVSGSTTPAAAPSSPEGPRGQQAPGLSPPIQPASTRSPELAAAAARASVFVPQLTHALSAPAMSQSPQQRPAGMMSAQAPAQGWMHSGNRAANAGGAAQAPSTTSGAAASSDEDGPTPSLLARNTLQSFFMSENLRQSLVRESFLIRRVTASQPNGVPMPESINEYHTLALLDGAVHGANSLPPPVPLGVSATAIKGISSIDGAAYVLRHINKLQVTSNSAFSMQAAGRWRSIVHPGLATLRDVFVSKDLTGSNALFLVYDYYPGALTLLEQHLTPPGRPVPESVLWSYATQIASAIRVIHSAGHFCGMLTDMSKVLVTEQNRIRINVCGMMDILQLKPPTTLHDMQQLDILAFGHLLLNLACGSPIAHQDIRSNMEFVASRFSEEMRQFLWFLLSKQRGMDSPDVYEVCRRLVGPMLSEMDNLRSYTDVLKSELTKELDNGRLFRLITKLGFINERPEFGRDPTWSETGDRYLLKLFRDYLFHQATDTGEPIVDFGHVVETCNKLDMAADEQICLTSRDGKNVIVVAYRDLLRCLNDAFQEVVSRDPQAVRSSANFRL